MKLAFKIALFCGLAPLIFAAIILTGWLLTGEKGFLLAGLFNILAGLILFTIGIGCLLYYEFQHRQQHQQSAWKKIVKPFLLLIVNFPAAAGCIYLVIFMMSVNVVSVVNQSQEYIPAIHLNISKLEQKTIKGILPKDKRKKHLRFKSAGTVDYSFELNGQERTGTLISYVSNHQGKKVVMTISENGQVSVEEKQK